MATILLYVDKGTDEWDSLLETLGADAPEEMATEDYVEIDCDLEYDRCPAEPDVGYMHPYNEVNGAFWQGHDLSSFFTDDQLNDAADGAEQDAYDAHIDAEIDRMRDERLGL